MSPPAQLALAIALIISGLSTAGISFATTLTRTTTNAALTAQAKTFVPQKHQGLLLLAGGVSFAIGLVLLNDALGRISEDEEEDNIQPTTNQFMPQQNAQQMQQIPVTGQAKYWQQQGEIQHKNVDLAIPQKSRVVNTQPNVIVPPNQSQLEQNGHYQNPVYGAYQVNPNLLNSPSLKEETACDYIINNFFEIAGANRLSLAFVGPPGVRKTSAMEAWMVHAFKHNPKTQFQIIGVKNDTWLGLRDVEGVFAIIKRDSASGLIDWSPLFKKTHAVSSILDQRLGLEEKERANQAPVWLILDDLYGIVSGIEKDPRKEVKAAWKICQSQWGQIITWGRDSHVGLVAGTHTFNASNLGLTEDSNLRGCLSLCCLGLITTDVETGQKEGGFGAVANALNNPYILEPDEKTALKEQFEILKEKSVQFYLPICFTNMGGSAIGLLPPTQWVDDYQIVKKKPEPATVREQLEKQYTHPELNDFWH